MGKVNASSVNTIRCITFNTEHGIQIGYCFAKFGRDGSFVDNGARGGLLVGVDRVTGYLVTDGYDEYGIKYCKHPDSSVTFKNYKLEKWDQLISICLEASSLIPSVRYIGWDLALTPDGWIIVEGNGGGQMIGPQTVFERGLKREINQMIGRKYVPDNFRKGKSK